LRILLDVDGVFADFLGATLQLLKDNGYNKNISEDDITSWDIVSCVGDDWSNVIESGWRQEGWFEGLNPYGGSHEAFDKISSLFDEVYFVTAPMPNHKTWAHERISWLKNNFKIKNSQIIITESKHVVFGDVLIDDSLPNISGWAKNSWAEHPVLWDRPYNKFASNAISSNKIIRSNSWEYFFNYVQMNCLYRH